MFHNKTIEEYERLSYSKTELNTLKRFTLKEDSEKEEVYNLNVILYIADKLKATGVLVNTYSVFFIIEGGLKINLPSVLTETWHSLSNKSEDTDKVPTFRTATNTNCTCVHAHFNVLMFCNKSKYIDLYTRESNGYTKTDFTRNNIINYLWSFNLVASSSQVPGVNLTLSSVDIESAEELANFYTQKLESKNLLSSGYIVWLKSYASAVRSFIKSARWPGYKEFCKKLLPITKTF